MTNNRALKIAVIGAGPAGFYTIEEITRLANATGTPVEFDLINREHKPGGLVIYGVVPDHPKIRAVNKIFEKILQRPEVRYFGNVEIPKDVSLEEIRNLYDLVIFSFGAQGDRYLSIP